MSTNKTSGSSVLNALALLSWVLAYVLSARISWSILDPKSVLLFVAFIPLWIVLGYAIQRVLFLFVTALAVAVHVVGR